jgi:hypothetical protein
MTWPVAPKGVEDPHIYKSEACWPRLSHQSSIENLWIELVLNLTL